MAAEFWVRLIFAGRAKPLPMEDMGMVEGPNWRDCFDERQLKEIEFCRLYVRDFKHGTDGHHLRLIVAMLANLLDRAAGDVSLVNLTPGTAYTPPPVFFTSGGGS